MKYLLLILITSLFFLLCATSPIHAISGSCSAGNTTEFKTCVTKFNENLIDTILVTANIDCNPTHLCNYVFTNNLQPLTIKGTTTNSGFSRSQIETLTTQFIFSFGANQNITLTNLSFEDKGTICNPINNNDGHLCKRIITFRDSSNVIVDHIKMTNVRGVPLNFTGASQNILPKFTVQNSIFTNITPHVIGSNFQHTVPQGGVAKILNNTFENIKNNAFALNINSFANNPSIVSGNIVSHAHTTPLYGTAGGQVYIFSYIKADPESIAQNIIVEKNLIIDGFSDETEVWGIEVFPVNVKNITIQNNVIVNNNGAIILAPKINKVGIFDSSNINFKNNFLFNNYSIVNNYGNPHPIIESGSVQLTSRAAALAKFNEIRPSPPPLPTPVTNPGDLEPDGDVDIFDFNSLVSRFGQTGAVGWIRADIIKNGKVDIFDFNALVSNFGR